jgi:hypothetical protein
MTDYVRADRIEPWWLDDLDTSMALRRNEVPRVDSGGTPVLIDNPDGEDDKVQAETVTVQGRAVASLTMTRQVFGLTWYQSERGMKRLNFSFQTGPTSSISWNTTGWICSRDSIKCTSSEAGEYLQVQTWEYFGSWANFPPGYFG